MCAKYSIHDSSNSSETQQQSEETTDLPSIPKVGQPAHDPADVAVLTPTVGDGESDADVSDRDAEAVGLQERAMVEGDQEALLRLARMSLIELGRKLDLGMSEAVAVMRTVHNRCEHPDFEAPSHPVGHKVLITLGENALYTDSLANFTQMVEVALNKLGVDTRYIIVGYRGSMSNDLPLVREWRERRSANMDRRAIAVSQGAPFTVGEKRVGKQWKTLFKQRDRSALRWADQALVVKEGEYTGLFRKRAREVDTPVHVHASTTFDQADFTLEPSEVDDEALMGSTPELEMERYDEHFDGVIDPYEDDDEPPAGGNFWEGSVDEKVADPEHAQNHHSPEPLPGRGETSLDSPDTQRTATRRPNADVEQNHSALRDAKPPE